MKAHKLLISSVFSLTLASCNVTPSFQKNNNEDLNQNTIPSANIGMLNGEQLFVACGSCHSLEPGAQHKLGPNLYGIIDRPAATMEDYVYSDALKRSGLTWNKGTLAGWIMATENIVPGTWMAYHNHLSPQEVTRLIEFIANAK